MPTSVLLAILAAAGLLALAPALVRRHDVVERQVAERARSTARVLSRDRRRRRPVRHRAAAPAATTARVRADAGPAAPPVPTTPPRASGIRSATPSRASGVRSATASPHRGRVRRPPRRHASPVIRRRRRVLAALLLLNLVELAGVAMVGPGFWVGFAVTATLLAMYLVHLRLAVVAEQRRRRRLARRAAMIAAQQAEIRRAQELRAAVRRESARRMAAQRESLRRAAASGSAPAVLYRAVPPRRERAG